MKQNNKTARILAGVFCALLLLFCLIWYASRPAPVQGTKTITVQVVHSDGSDRSFTYVTDREYLGEVLTDEGLISGSEGAYGIFVDTVDGETALWAVDQGWWRLSCNGQDAETGADSVVIQDGDAFVWTYTIGS